MPDLSPPLEISSCFQRLQMVAKFLWMMIRPRSITSSSSAVVASHAILVGSRHQARLVSSVPSRMSSLLRLLVFAVQSYVLSTLEHLPHWLNRESFTFNLDHNNAFQPLSLQSAIRSVYSRSCVSRRSFPPLWYCQLHGNYCFSFFESQHQVWSQSYFYNVWKDKLLVKVYHQTPFPHPLRVDTLLSICVTGSLCQYNNLRWYNVK